MTIVHLRPNSWGDMTPSQWGVVRTMIREVLAVATSGGNSALMFRARHFFSDTEMRDVVVVWEPG